MSTRSTTSIETSSATPPGLTIESVVSVPRRLEQWKKLHKKEPLAALHAEFWGKSITEDVKAWTQKKQSTSNPTGSKEDSDGSLSHDETKLQSTPGPSKGDCKVREDAKQEQEFKLTPDLGPGDSDGDDDIGLKHSSYVLDIESRAIRMRKIWVRVSVHVWAKSA
jgi:hypothetical protein